MLTRFAIVMKWALFSGILFFCMSLFLNDVLASMIATVITAGAFFHPDNEYEVFKLKRPQLIIRGQK